MAKGISETLDGLLIRIYRGGHPISQHVGWGQYETRAAARQAAAKVHADLEAAYPKAPRAHRKPSVGYTYQRGGGDFGKKYPCWQVVYYVGPDEIRKTKRFFIHLYDDPAQAKKDAHMFAERHENDWMLK